MIDFKTKKYSKDLRKLAKRADRHWKRALKSSSHVEITEIINKTRILTIAKKNKKIK